MNNENLNIITIIIEKSRELSQCKIDIKYNEPMSGHTTFKVGGHADCYVKPTGEKFPSFCVELFKREREKNIPVFILGGGANIVVSDNGIRGIVLDTVGWKGIIESSKNDTNKCELLLKSGTTMDEAAEIALEKSLTGLEFLAGMPGTIGGAVYMNARCYGKEISDVLAWTEVINFAHELRIFDTARISTNRKDFDYKYSPFQDMECLIVSACFKLQNGNKEKIKAEMEKNRQDRKEKGHYLFPSAGSAFKNNRDFGKPTGQIIDELGMRGLSEGGAQIAPFHGNIVINKNNATAKDIRNLMDIVAVKVKEKTGFILEPEIIFIGDC